MYTLKMGTGGSKGEGNLNQISDLGVESVMSDFELLPNIYYPFAPLVKMVTKCLLSPCDGPIARDGHHNRPRLGDPTWVMPLIPHLT